ncbi:hypothetical protein [Chelatococcus sp. HY11]|uniref:oxidoreductase n=1 Tax=unclassified Chelatococcus TaxID=2638111 RepID=UPI0032E01B7A
MDSLFEPFALGDLRLPNRIAMAPMTREFCPGGVPSQDVVDYYRRRAEGGTGLILTEGAAINRVGMRNEFIPRFYGNDALAGWKSVVDAVHAAGASIMPQLWHVGIQQTDTVINPNTIKSKAEMIGPSGLTGLGETVGAPMTQKQIDETIADFGDATAAAARLGFDGIELHGAHGYLLDQFLWNFTNRRSDAYGGGIAERTRFATEVVRECRRRGGPGFPIVFRYSQWKIYDYGAQLASVRWWTRAWTFSIVRPVGSIRLPFPAAPTILRNGQRR